MSLPERRKETDRKYRQARAELKIWQDRIKFRAKEWIKIMRKQFNLPRSYTFSNPLTRDIPAEERNLQAQTAKIVALSAQSGPQGLLLKEEVAFRKERLIDLARLMEIQNKVSNLEKQLMHLGDPVKDTGGYKIRFKTRSASIFKHTDRRKLIGLFLLVGCVALGIYGITFLFPKGAEWGDTVRIYYEIYDPSMTLLEKTPSDGIYLTLSDTSAAEPQLLHEQIRGRQLGASFWVNIPACQTHDCAKYGGFTYGTLAWRELRINVTLIEIQKP